jgi:DNA polymerase III delta prime subunit
MRNLLLNERWRPRSIDEMVLPERIREAFRDGVRANYIFYGHYGTGKTTLARILIGKWSRDRPHIEVNSSFHTSIETLRTKVDDFCSNVYMGLDLDGESHHQGTKYVFLDEFERTSPQYQDALKAYIEEYSARDVRFILNTNHIEKVTEGIRSRMVKICFDPADAKEEKQMKMDTYRRIAGIIAPAEGIEIDKAGLVKIINSSFPDFRAALNALQFYKATGRLPAGGASDKLRSDLFALLDNPGIDGEAAFNFVVDNFGPDNVESLVRMLGTEYTTWLIANGKADRVFRVANEVAMASMQLQSCLDPVVVAVALMGRLAGAQPANI